jgi:putative endonuclease
LSHRRSFPVSGRSQAAPIRDVNARPRAAAQRSVELPIGAIRETNATMESFVYVIGCADERRYLTYVGWTLDVERRLAQHNAGTGARSTRRRQWGVVHVERFATREDAMSREWHLKRDRRFRKSLTPRADAASHITS